MQNGFKKNENDLRGGRQDPRRVGYRNRKRGAPERNRNGIQRKDGPGLVCGRHRRQTRCLDPRIRSERRNPPDPQSSGRTPVTYRMAPREGEDLTRGTGLAIPVSMLFNPTQDDYERAKEKARELLRSILTESEWKNLEDKGVIRLQGKRGDYLISPYSQTEIRDLKSDRCVAYACLQISLPVPTYDRMVAEYLLIRNAEDVYWKTANIFSRNGNEFSIATLFLIAFDIALSLNLLL